MDDGARRAVPLAATLERPSVATAELLHRGDQTFRKGTRWRRTAAPPGELQSLRLAVPVAAPVRAVARVGMLTGTCCPVGDPSAGTNRRPGVHRWFRWCCRLCGVTLVAASNRWSDQPASPCGAGV